MLSSEIPLTRLANSFLLASLICQDTEVFVIVKYSLSLSRADLGPVTFILRVESVASMSSSGKNISHLCM